MTVILRTRYRARDGRATETGAIIRRMAAPRDGSQRKADALAKLAAREADCWVATASPEGREYLVPLSYAWDGSRVILATEPGLTTARNIAASGRARLGFGPTRDVLIVDVVLEASLDSTDPASAEIAELYAGQADWDPREESGPFVYLLMRPVRIQAWREANELAGRTIMRDGEWLF